MRRCITLCTVVLASIPVGAAAQGFALTVENIMRGPDLVGTAPFNVQFDALGHYVYLRWRQPGADTLDQDYRVAVADARQIQRLARNAVDTIPLATGAWSPDRRRLVVVLKGDLWLVERDGTKRRLTSTPGAETAPAWSADGRRIFFTRDQNCWALDFAGAVSQLTDIRRGPAPRVATEPAGEKKFLRDQQRELFDFIRRQVADERLRADTDTVATVKPLYLAERQTPSRLQVSPDGRFVLVTVTERARGDSTEGRAVQMPVWVTQSGYVETQQIRTKVGDAQARLKAALIEVATGKVTWVQTDSGIPKGLPDARGKRETDAAGVGFSATGRHALVRITSTDYQDAWLVVVDLPSLARREVAHLHDDAWLDGPLGNTAGWIPASETVYYGSEQTGYAHVYTVPAGGGAARALTSGAWEVQQVDLAPDGRTLYLHTNEGDFGQVHFYALDIATGRRTQLTAGEGRQDVVVSPDGRTLAVLHSTANHPPELYLQAARPGAAMQKVTESTSPEFRSYEWVKPEIVMIPTGGGNGAQVPARLYRPRGTGATGAAVIFVHGAGYLQNVHRWWSWYYREYMFHHLLASKGYAVLDLDYRGSAGLGRAWRTAIYRHMGGLDLEDQVSGARWLVANLGIDSTRIGIYGGSYGGFITLMALFTKPGVFAAGAALRPVTDWAHYNHPYTARILNEPQSDTIAYRQSSPIYFAEGLKGRLLICHGMVDDNVHFQDTARLIQRLIELGKDNWEAAVYPVEPHGFRRNDSWTDEYRRILHLFDGALAAAR
ncbi:MAG TPA: prolyl oligopeptidase family serine peptidase [Gemmatimonadales bacterium]